MKNKAITSRDQDFAKWYTDVVMAAKLADYSNTKGCIVFEPNGYAIWERMQQVLDAKFKETGHQNVYMPVLIPESLLNKEAELIEGFAPEGAWVTHGGTKKLEERLMIRPTSETLFSDYFSSKVRSHRDLPLKLNQWANVMRWEKETRPFLRTREFLWQEGHTVHATQEEAEAEAMQMLEVYRDFFINTLAIPAIVGRKTEKEKFAGAEWTQTVESLMYNGVSLQSGTSHYFGQKFAKAYNINFVDKQEKTQFAYQTSWGVTTRMIGALIMVHSDDNGLVLPPNIAPRQVAIVPIGKDEEIFEIADNMCKQLKDANITAFVDKTEKSPGFKFAEHEVNGIPVRVEVGKRDLENGVITLARRDTREKMQVSKDCNIAQEIKTLLQDIQQNMLETATKRRDLLTYKTDDLDEFRTIMTTKPGFIHSHWCGDEKCELALKDIRGTKSRCITNDKVEDHHKCIVCGKPAKYNVIWGIQY